MQAKSLALWSASCWLGLLSIGCGAQRGAPAVVSASNAAQPLGVSCLGRLTPGDRIIKVSAPPQSIVKELHVRRGSQVRQGQELAILRDYAVAAAALDESVSEVAVAESAVVQAKAGEKPSTIAAQEAAVRHQQAVLLNSQTDFERKQALFHDRLVSAAEFEAAQLSLETARQGLSHENEVLQSMKQVRPEDVYVAEKKLEAARVQEAYAKAVLDQNRILAPAAGTVLEIHAYPGEAVSSDGLLDLGDLSQMFVEAEVYVTDIPRIRDGARATITGEGFRGSITGKVVEILRQASDNRLYPTDALTAADKRVLGVRIRLDDASPVQHLSNSQVSVFIEP